MCVSYLPVCTHTFQGVQGGGAYILTNIQVSVPRLEARMSQGATLSTHGDGQTYRREAINNMQITSDVYHDGLEVEERKGAQRKGKQQQT